MSNLPWHELMAMIAGYCVLGCVVIYVIAAIWCHTIWTIADTLAHIRFTVAADGLGGVKWWRIPDVFVLKWFLSWTSWEYGLESTTTWNDLGTWTSPSHPFSLGTYHWFDKAKP